MISVASRSAAMIEALRDVNGLAGRPSTVPLKIFFKREQTVRSSLIYTTRTFDRSGAPPMVQTEIE
jgi:hypothetical protein